LEAVARDLCNVFGVKSDCAAVFGFSFYNFELCHLKYRSQFKFSSLRRRLALAFRGVPEFLTPTRFGLGFNAPHTVFNTDQYIGAFASHEFASHVPKTFNIFNAFNIFKKLKVLKVLKVLKMLIILDTYARE
jgi:hypothetical protein